MDLFIVGIIVAGAFVFTIRGFIKAYRGEKSCSCGGCTCAGKESSSCKAVQILDKVDPIQN